MAGRSRRNRPQWFCWYRRSGLPAGETHAMRVVSELDVGIGLEVRAHALVQRPPVGAAVLRFEHPAARHADIHMQRVTRVDQDRMQFRSVRRAVLVAAAPRLALRMRVETRDPFPRRATVDRAEESLRRGAGPPDARLRSVARCEPERVIDDAAAVGRERGRLHRFLPRATAVRRAEHRRPEMAGTCGRQQRLAVARIEHRVVDDVAQELRTGELP